MPTVNVHYRFEKDALIDTVYQITFGGVPADLPHDEIAPNIYEGIVKEVYITSQFEVAVELGGVYNAAWSMTVQTATLTGTLKDIDTKPIQGNLDANGYCWYSKKHKIK